MNTEMLAYCMAINPETGVSQDYINAWQRVYSAAERPTDEPSLDLIFHPVHTYQEHVERHFPEYWQRVMDISDKERIARIDEIVRRFNQQCATMRAERDYDKAFAMFVEVNALIYGRGAKE